MSIMEQKMDSVSFWQSFYYKYTPKKREQTNNYLTTHFPIKNLRGIPSLFLAKFESIVHITFPKFEYIVLIVEPFIISLFNSITMRKCYQYLKGYNYHSDESPIIPFYIAYLKLQHNILVDIKDVKKSILIRIANNKYRQDHGVYMRIKYLCGDFY